jgi:hypothetical protein
MDRLLGDILIARVHARCVRDGKPVSTACQEIGITQRELLALDDRQVDPLTAESITDWLKLPRPHSG